MRFVFYGILSDSIVVSTYPLGIWPNFHLFYSDSERFFRILSHSLKLLWILPNLLVSLDFFRFFPIFFPTRLEFDWILLYSFFFLIWIFSDYLVFFQNLCLFFGFFWILSDYTQFLSDSSVLSTILSIFGRILRHPLGFFCILLDNLRFFWNLGGFSRIHLHSFRFFQILPDFLEICLNSLIFSRISFGYFKYAFRNFRIHQALLQLSSRVLKIVSYSLGF